MNIGHPWAKHVQQVCGQNPCLVLLKGIMRLYPWHERTSQQSIIPWTCKQSINISLKKRSLAEKCWTLSVSCWWRSAQMIIGISFSVPQSTRWYCSHQQPKTDIRWHKYYFHLTQSTKHLGFSNNRLKVMSAYCSAAVCLGVRHFTDFWG